MRTAHDLKTAFADIADTAPHPDVLTIPTSRARAALPKRGRRVLLPVAAALATAAVVGGVVVAAGGPDLDAPPGRGNVALPVLPAPKADGSPDRTFRFTAAVPTGTVVSRGIDRGGQVLSFNRPPSGGSCDPSCTLDRRVAEVRLYWVHPPVDPDEPSFSPGNLTDRHPVRVDGHPGFFGRPSGQSFDPSERLVWEYAPGAWAQVIASSRTAMLALARSVRPATVTLQVPVDPARFSDDEYLNLVESEESRAGGHLELTTPNAHDEGFYIDWGTNKDTSVDRATSRHPIVNGRSWTIEVQHGQPVAVLDRSPVPLTVTGYIGTTTQDLERFLAHLRLARSLTDSSTWFAAAHALP